MNLKTIFTNYLSWIFIALGILFLILDLRDSFSMGIGTWNLNRSIGRSNWLGISSIPPSKIIWRIIFVCGAVYTLIKSRGGNTHLLLSVLHVLLTLSCFVIPEYWYTLGWTLPILNAVLLALNLMYAFFWNKAVPETLDDILDAE
jgi:hypothetical protein